MKISELIHKHKHCFIKLRCCSKQRYFLQQIPAKYLQNTDVVHFIDKEMEIQRQAVKCPESHSS